MGWSICMRLGVYSTSFVIDSEIDGDNHFTHNANIHEMYGVFTRGTGQSASNEGMCELIHHLDLEKKLLIIINKAKPTEVVHVTGTPSKVYPIVVFKVSTATITGHGAELLEGVDLECVPTKV